MISVATFCPTDPGTNLAGLMSRIQIKNRVFTNNSSMRYYSKYCYPVVGDEQPIKETL